MMQQSTSTGKHQCVKIECILFRHLLAAWLAVQPAVANQPASNLRGMNFVSACSGVSKQNTEFLFGINDSSRVAVRTFNEPSSVNTVEFDWEALLTELAEQDKENTVMEEWREQLAELAEHPIKLNTASREQLESIPFLSRTQTDALAYYIFRYGPVIDLSELMLVDGFNEQTLRWLTPFIYPGDPMLSASKNTPLKTILSHGKTEIRCSIGRTLQKKMGYMTNEPSGVAYAGDPWLCSFRYGFNYKDKVQWGVTCQKDAGERWLDKRFLPDYVTFHALIKGSGFVKTLLAGDYSLSFGQGLVCGNSFSMGKSMTLTQPEVVGQVLKRHVSTGESGYLRGLSASFDVMPDKKTSLHRKQFVHDMTLTTFASLRHLDANLNGDMFTTISETGLHRTVQEQNARNQVRMVTSGAHLSVLTDKVQIGLTALYWHFNAELNQTWQPYNCFYARGKTGANASFNYRLRLLGTTWFGELATDKSGHFAGISGFSMQPSTRIDLSFLYRNYAPAYNAFHSNAFGEGSAVRNEKGCYVSLEWRMVPHIRLNAFYDVFIFPWLTYQCDVPSSGYDTGLQLIVQLSHQAELLMRFKQKSTEKNVVPLMDKHPFIEAVMKNQYRMQYTDKSTHWIFQTVFDFNTFENELTDIVTQGVAVSQTIRFTPFQKKLDLSVRFSLFDATNYDNRIFSYEKSLPGCFSMPLLYGQGARLGFCLTYNITKRLSWWLKAGYYIYQDRSQTGTNEERAEGNDLTNAQCLIRWNF